MSTSVNVPDAIEKKILLRAPRARVWRALSDARQFGAWFGMRINGEFAPGAVIRGTMAPTTVDPEVAQLQKPHEGKPVEIMIERVEPERVFSFRWHPFAKDRNVDYSAEPTTLVEFVLADTPEGILLTVTESGFSRIPLARRVEAFTANEGGWPLVVKLVEKYLAQSA